MLKSWISEYHYVTQEPSAPLGPQKKRPFDSLDEPRLSQQKDAHKAAKRQLFKATADVSLCESYAVFQRVSIWNTSAAYENAVLSNAMLFIRTARWIMSIWKEIVSKQEYSLPSWVSVEIVWILLIYMEYPYQDKDWIMEMIQ